MEAEEATRKLRGLKRTFDLLSGTAKPMSDGANEDYPGPITISSVLEKISADGLINLTVNGVQK